MIGKGYFSQQTFAQYETLALERSTPRGCWFWAWLCAVNRLERYGLGSSCPGYRRYCVLSLWYTAARERIITPVSDQGYHPIMPRINKTESNLNVVEPLQKAP